MSKLKKAKPLTLISVYIFMIVMAVIMLFPYVWMVMNSFRSSRDIVLSPLALFTGPFTIEAYQGIMTLGGRPLIDYLLSSFIITASSVILTLIVCSLGAYALTRKPNLPGFKAANFFFLVSIMYPWALLVIPIYLTVFRLGLLGSYIGIILAITGGASVSLPYFIFQQFFKTVPYEIIECAELEGAKEFTILTRIIVPMAKPVIGTVALISFMFTWGEWFYVMVLSVTMKTATLPVALLNLNSEFGQELNSIMALSSLLSIPIIILFILTQKKIIEGLAQGSVKG